MRAALVTHAGHDYLTVSSDWASRRNGALVMDDLPREAPIIDDLSDYARLEPEHPL